MRNSIPGKMSSFAAGSISMDRFRAGEEDAFSKVYQHYYKTIHYFAMGYLNNREQAEEVVSDSMMKLWNNRQHFLTVENIQAFLFISTKNACLDVLKKERKQPEQLHEEVLTTDLISEEPDVLARMMESELLRRIESELRKLPAKQQQVFRKSFLEGMANDEIAAKLNMTINAVYANKSMAVAALRLALNRYYPLILLFFSGYSHYLSCLLF